MSHETTDALTLSAHARTPSGCKSGDIKRTIIKKNRRACRTRAMLQNELGMYSPRRPVSTMVQAISSDCISLSLTYRGHDCDELDLGASAPFHRIVAQAQHTRLEPGDGPHEQRRR
jgi:hypothetical protein